MLIWSQDLSFLVLVLAFRISTKNIIAFRLKPSWMPCRASFTCPILKVLKNSGNLGPDRPSCLGLKVTRAAVSPAPNHLPAETTQSSSHPLPHACRIPPHPDPQRPLGYEMEHPRLSCPKIPWLACGIRQCGPAIYPVFQPHGAYLAPMALFLISVPGRPGSLWQWLESYIRHDIVWTLTEILQS